MLCCTTRERPEHGRDEAGRRAPPFPASFGVSTADQYGDVDPAPIDRCGALPWHLAARRLAIRRGHRRTGIQSPQRRLRPSARQAGAGRLQLGPPAPHAGWAAPSAMGHRPRLLDPGGQRAVVGHDHRLHHPDGGVVDARPEPGRKVAAMAGYRTPLARVRGLGSAKDGTEHFLRQRVTAIANIFLVSFGILSIVRLAGADYLTVRRTLAEPLNTIALLLLILSGVVHMRIGMQTIIEDYVHADGYKVLALLINTFFAVVVGLASAYAVLKLSFGA